MATVSEQTAYIRQAAAARGIDPDIAVRVARSEGLAAGVWQSNYSKNGIREPSFGPFQLLVGGGNTGFGQGLGNAFESATGLKASDPANVYKSIDFALDNAAKSGWGAWYGAAKAGVGNREGLDGAKAIGITGEKAPTGIQVDIGKDPDTGTGSGSGSSSGGSSAGSGSVPAAIDKQTATQAATAQAVAQATLTSEQGIFSGYVSSLKDYFGRFVLVFLGIIFVGGGVAMFTLSNKSVQKVVGKTAAGRVAKIKRAM